MGLIDYSRLPLGLCGFLVKLITVLLVRIFTPVDPSIVLFVTANGKGRVRNTGHFHLRLNTGQVQLQVNRIT